MWVLIDSDYGADVWECVVIRERKQVDFTCRRLAGVDN